ncbi:MAG: hypothetical protein IJK06_05580, partial [Clostridia bacterium]|nr:hypothetical protein [Clostridia bacterium]
RKNVGEQETWIKKIRMREVDLSLNQPDQDKSNGANREMRNDMLFCPDENGPCIKGAFHDMELFFNFHKIAVGVEYFHRELHLNRLNCSSRVIDLPAHGQGMSDVSWPALP